MSRAWVGMIVATSIGSMAMAQSNAPQASVSAPAAAPKTWADNITFKGDLRYRYETRNDDSKLNKDKETYTRELNRIRARLGAEAKCNDNLKAGIGLSTGGADPVSGNSTLGDGFSKDEMRLDLAYFDYNFFLDSPTEVHAIGGKMKNPFITMNDDLAWDSDLNPEGLGLKGQCAAGPATLLVNGGYLWVQERNTDDSDDTMLYAGQGAVRLQFVPEASLTLGASYYGYQNMKGYDVIDWENKNNSYGNSTTKGSVSGSTTNKAYATEYTPVVLFGQLDLWLAGVPVALFGQSISNTDADQFDQGHMFGASIGKAKNPKTWELGYSYAELEKDATVGAFTDSDRWGGGTDGQGSKFYGRYQIMKNLQAGVTYFLDEKKISDPAKTTDYDRLQVDLVAAF